MVCSYSIFTNFTMFLQKLVQDNNFHKQINWFELAFFFCFSIARHALRELYSIQGSQNNKAYLNKEFSVR